GGKITFHGPGQLVGYPIVRLPDHVLVVDYVRRLEEALIGVCRDLGVETARVPGRSGVWLRAEPATDRGPGRPERKIAALGIRVARGVTMHGFALNCDVDLGWYDRFVPCGIADAGVTTLSEELGREVTVAEVTPLVESHVRRLLAWSAYDATPDYEPRPEPGRGGRVAVAQGRPEGTAADLRVPVLNPRA
ncbi:MAG: lipB, partial [Marmoricola sp.]|nr:lipB [Marmoricola sp.]